MSLVPHLDPDDLKPVTSHVTDVTHVTHLQGVKETDLLDVTDVTHVTHIEQMEETGLLDTVEQLLGRWVVFTSDAARWAVTLWIAHTHVLDAFDSTPRLALLSPEKGSGKTRTLEVIALLVPTPIETVNISPAALFRLVSGNPPTLLMDEADTYLGPLVAKNHEDLRGLINAGHRRGTTVWRCEVAGKNVTPTEYPAFAPCALASIGDLPDTILDRSVLIAMKRRAPHEQVESFRRRPALLLADPVKQALMAWGPTVVDELEEYYPELPDSITDRAADVWEPLIAIADKAGGHWPERAREAAVTLNDARVGRDPSLGVQLLTDVRRVFSVVDRLSTDTLLEMLNALDDAPWGDLRGKQLDARGLARRLRKYDIKPGLHRFSDGIRRGYLVDDFHDAWGRYLPEAVSPTPAGIVTSVTSVTNPVAAELFE